MKKFTIIYYTLLMIFLIGCHNEKTTNEIKEEENIQDDNIISLTKEQFTNGDFELGTIDSMYFSKTFKVSGLVDVPPQNRASVNTFFSGFVSNTSLIVGDFVKKGDLLLQLRNPEFIQMQQYYAENLSKLEFLEAEFLRKKNLLEEKVISKKVFQKAKSEYFSMKAKVGGERKTLQLMNININSVDKGQFTETISIYAPINGKISTINITQGMYVKPSFTIMEIINTGHIHLELDVFEKDLPNIKINDTLHFQIPEISNNFYPAIVKLIGAEIGENRSTRVHAHILDEKLVIPVGTFVNAFLETSKSKLIALPESAFSKVNKHFYILQYLDEKEYTYFFKKIEVEVGDSQNGFRPLLKFNSKEKFTKILTKGTFDLLSGEGDSHDH